LPGQGLIPLSYIQTLSESARVGASNLTPGLTSLAAAITSAGQTAVSVTTFSGFPQSGTVYIMIDSEQMLVTAGLGTGTWTCTRGTNGTTATTHLVTAPVFQCATSLLPIEPAFFEPMWTRYNPVLMRNSFEAFYETQIVDVHAELKGIKAPLTFETATNLFAYFIKGGVIPTTSDSHAYTYTYVPTLAADDLVGLGAEVGNDTATYHICALYGDQLVLEFVRGSDSAQMTADWLGQQALVMGAKTPGITRTGLNMLNPANTATYIDSTTIGSTLVNDITSAKVTIKNGFQQLFFLNGVLYPTGAVRPQRNLSVELIQWFDSATELAAAMSTSIGSGTERKNRLVVTGPTIPSSVLSNSLTFDSYLYWDTAPFKVDKDTWCVTYTGRSVYDTGIGGSWSATLVNGLAAMP
jgi:hypothetical protein